MMNTSMIGTMARAAARLGPRTLALLAVGLPLAAQASPGGEAPAKAAAVAVKPAWAMEFPRARTNIEAWMKRAQWEEQRGDADAWRISGGVLRTVQDEDSTTVGTSKGFPVVAEGHRKLRFRFRALKWPAKGNLAKKGTEDAALRIFVVFDRGGGILSPPDTLGYAFTVGQPKGAAVRSERFDNVFYISVESAKGYDGGWREVTVDLVDDYRTHFKRQAVPKIKAIAIKSDGNNTDAQVSAEIDWIRLSPR